MILTCPKCQSRYDVDPAGISEVGTYAHCRACENIFFVKRKKKQSIKPTSQEEVVPAVGEPAMAEEIGEEPIENKAQPASAEEIEAAIADIAAELNPKTAEQDKGEPEKISQTVAETKEPEAVQANSPTREEIDSLLSAVGAPETAESEKASEAEAEQPTPEKAAMSKQDEIDAMLASVGKGEEEQAEPEKAEPEATPVEVEAEQPAMSKQDEIDAMLASVNKGEEEKAEPEQVEPEQAEPEQVEPEQAEPEAAPVEVEAEQPAMSQQEEIDAMLASVNKGEEEKAEPEKVEPEQAEPEQVEPEQAEPEATPVEVEVEQPTMSKQDEIDAMLASVNKGEEEKAEPEKVEPEQAEPEQVEPEAAPVEVEAEQPAMSQQEEIDAMLASVNKGEEEKAEPEKVEPEQAEPEQAEPEQAEPEAPPVEVEAEQPAISQQDEIDAMLSAAESGEETAEEVKSETADGEALPEIPEWDSVLEDSTREMKTRELDLAGAESLQSDGGGNDVPKDEEANDTGHTAQLSVDDIDSLLEGVDVDRSSESVSTEPPGTSKEEETASIPSADIDSLLSGVKETAAGDEMETVAIPQEQSDDSAESAAIDSPAQENDDDEVISQEDLDNLFSKSATTEESVDPPVQQEDESPPVSQPEEAATVVQEDEPIITQGDLDTLFASETDQPSDEAEKVVSDSSTGVEASEKQLESLFESESTGSMSKEEVDEAVKDMADTDAETPKPESEDIWDDEDAVTASDDSTGAHGEAGEKKGSLITILFGKIRDKMPRFGRKKAAVNEEIETEAEAPSAEDADDFITELTKKKKKRPRRSGKRALTAAAVLALAIGGGQYFITAYPDVDIVATVTSVLNKQVERVSKKMEPVMQTEPEGTKPTSIAADAGGAMEPVKEKAASPKAADTELKLGIILPVDYNAEAVKVLSAEVFIRFKNPKELLTAQSKRFLYELAVENEIETFFSNRFYEDTHYAQDKLVAELYTKFRRRKDMETIKEIAIENFKLQ